MNKLARKTATSKKAENYKPALVIANEMQEMFFFDDLKSIIKHYRLLITKYSDSKDAKMLNKFAFYRWRDNVTKFISKLAKSRSNFPKKLSLTEAEAIEIYAFAKDYSQVMSFDYLNFICEVDQFLVEGVVIE
jgi:hypothetical protein